MDALSPSYAPLDEHNEQDVLAYIWELAKTIVYHEVKHDRLWKSDWLDFLRLSLPVQLALIGKFDLNALVASFEARIKKAEFGLERGKLAPLFRKVASIALLLNRWHENLPENTPLKIDLGALIEKDLRFVAARWARLANQAQEAESQEAEPKDAVKWSLELRPLIENSVWQLSMSDLMLADAGTAGAVIKGTETDRMSFYLEQLSTIFQVFADGTRRVIDLASSPAYQQSSLDGIKNHPAHIGLLVAFNRMFDRLRNEINDIPARQLDFYLKDVLGLEEEAAVPDNAHLIFELDKTVRSSQVVEGTRFKAAQKDDNNAEILFETGEETILNRARVDSLRTIFRQSDKDKKTTNIRAAIGANFFDGIAEPFPDPQTTQWKTLGGEHYPNGSPQDYARIGFFVASPALLLREGGARVKIAFTCKTQFTSKSDLSSYFKIYYSSEKGWVDATDFKRSKTALQVRTRKKKKDIFVSFYVNPGVPLTAADPSVLNVDYGTTFPMIKLEMKKPTDSHSWKFYDTLSRVEIEGIKITQSNIKLKDLILSSDAGVLNPANSFAPFGSAPRRNANFIIGSEEAFVKRLTSLSFLVRWDKVPASKFKSWYEFYTGSPNLNSDFKAKLEYLNEGIWSELDKNLIPLFAEGNARKRIKIDVASPATIPIRQENASNFSNLAVNGFVRLRLTPKDFLHAEYPKALYRQAIKEPPNTPPNEPYTPAIKEFILRYSTEESLCNDSGDANQRILFGHLHPFEVQNFERMAIRGVETGPSLLPLINPFKGEGGYLMSEGTLLIGLTDLIPGSTQSLLFQVAEATADPEFVLKGKMKWWYLDDNDWVELQKDVDILGDATRNLTTSGIVRLAIPQQISNKNTTILPADKHWLRVTLRDGGAGVADAVAVHTQAIQTQAYLSPANDTGRLDTPLEAESIAKLVVSNASIKSLVQPYRSFGGRPKEDEAAFRRRVSERLRHKGRAVTLFDYERLVLQHFPQIYKVKCLPHTRVQDDNSLVNAPDHDTVDKKLFVNAPGHVTAVVIPDITQFSFAEKLQPKASRALLESIQAFLAERATPFLRLHVVNPRYQGIRVFGSVAFMPGKDRVFYQTQLTRDILEFMTPWAFGELDRLSFGGRIFKSSILHHIERLPYVDYLVDFVIESDAGELPDDSVIEADTEHSILVYKTGETTAWSEPSVKQPPDAEEQAKGLGYQAIPFAIASGEAKHEKSDDSVA
ncbi:MAG: hypothetical protein AAF564_16070 [Bacteroidota bacterium]